MEKIVKFEKAIALLCATEDMDPSPVCLGINPVHEFMAVGLPWDIAPVTCYKRGFWVWEGAVEYEVEGDVIWSTTKHLRPATTDDLNQFGYPVEPRAPKITGQECADAIVYLRELEHSILGENTRASIDKIKALLARVQQEVANGR